MAQQQLLNSSSLDQHPQHSPYFDGELQNVLQASIYQNKIKNYSKTGMH